MAVKPLLCDVFCFNQPFLLIHLLLWLLNPDVYMFGDKIPKTLDYFAILPSLFHGSLKRHWFWTWIEQPIHNHAFLLTISQVKIESNGEILMLYDVYVQGIPRRWIQKPGICLQCFGPFHQQRQIMIILMFRTELAVSGSVRRSSGPFQPLANHPNLLELNWE